MHDYIKITKEEYDKITKELNNKLMNDGFLLSSEVEIFEWNGNYYKIVKTTIEFQYSNGSV